MILYNQKYIVSHSEDLKIFNKSNFSPIPVKINEKIKLFSLSNDLLIFSNDNGLFCYSIPKAIENKLFFSKEKITALFIKESFIYAGFSNGSIKVFTFNEKNANLTQSYEHSVPITGIVSDNIKIYVTDLRDKVTVYPENQSYEYIEPKLFFKKHPFVLSENKLFVLSHDFPLFLFEFNKTVETIQFGQSGGTVISRDGRFVCINDTLGNIQGRTLVSSRNFAVIEKNGFCSIVEEDNGTLKTTDCYTKDLPLPEFEFPKKVISERIITEEEYEKKHLFVDDGNKRNVKRIVNSPRNKNVRQSFVDDSDSCIGESSGKSLDSDSSIDEFTLTNENTNNFTEIKESTNNFTEFIDPMLTVRNPFTFENKDSKLLFYSSQGFMLSIESPLSCQISIKFHDRNFEPIEIKDNLKCKLGAFYNENYVISDGESIDFSGKWKKEIKCSLLGMNKDSIVSFDENCCTIFDYSGKIRECFYVKNFYSFCLGTKRIAVFCKDFTMLMNLFDFSVEYVPTSGIEFGCFDGDDLYVKIGVKMFLLKKDILSYQCEIRERPLTVYDNNVVTLVGNELLPRPKLHYHPIKEEKVEEIEFDMNKLGRYTPGRY